MRSRQGFSFARTLAPFGLLLPIVAAALLLAPAPQPSPCIVVVAETSVEPAIPNFSAFPAGDERKEAFVSYFLPLINAENERIRQNRSQLLCLQQRTQLLPEEKHWIKSIAKRYGMNKFNPKKAGHWQTLLRRVDVISPSLALAQAANESAWGTSRFARKGNNFFGQWCFKKGCGMVPLSRPDGATYEVAVFKSPKQSVSRYMLNLNSSHHYTDLRRLREENTISEQVLAGTQLALGLTKYSTRGESYITELQEMILHNNWHELDRS
ncbi:glucosaminidase domain-containing protein [Porticoccaceae bacterium LTM1]|nr:glucosaminidase domain-containing protein [Porticoccaceae bacterium LTM1]